MILDAESIALIGGIPFEAEPIRRRDLGPLHDLLLKACPREPDGSASIKKLAAIIEVTPAAVYKWIAAGFLSSRRARQIINVSDDRVTIEDFMPYLG